MKIFTKDNQSMISGKYKIDFSDFSKQEVIYPSYNEYVGSIYLFVNNINGKVYVGQTITKFSSRFGGHFTDAFVAKDNLPFHIALRKYEWSNFSKYIIFQTEIFERTEENKEKLKKILNEKEIYYISEYNANDPKFGYNATKGGDYMPENAHSKESIAKALHTKEINHSHNMLGKTYDKHHLAVHILQYSLNKEFIKEWTCIKLAEDTLHISIIPKGVTSGGFFWLYNTSDKEKLLEDKYTKYLLTNKNGVPKPVRCLDFYGETLGIYESAFSAGRICGIPYTEIAHAAEAQENGNVVHDCIWIYEENLDRKDLIVETLRNKSRVFKSKYRPIYQIYLTGEIIKLWNSLEEIRNSEFPNTASISKCLAGTLNTYQNCFWIYEDEYTDDLINDKLEKFSKTKKTQVAEAFAGNKEVSIKHDTSSNKNFLKENPVVYQYTKDLQLVKIWNNYKDINKETGLNFDNISKCLRGKLKTAFGYIWRYEKDKYEE